MKTITKIIPGIAMGLLFCLSQSATAQEVGCKDEAGFSAFDFWLGEWDVSSAGEPAGSNTVSRIESGCALMEQWRGVGGTTGMSINYYNPVTEQWRQLWVSANRYSIDISGGLVDGAMVLEGLIYNFAGGEAKFRGTWSENADGSVRQFFEQYSQNANEWVTWFDGRYERKS